MMKTCSKCKKEKPFEEFNYKNKFKKTLQYQCKICSRIYIRSHYERNKKYYLLKAKLRNDANRKVIKTYIRNYLINNPCVDCGENDPIVLEFDHLSDKISDISAMNRNFTLEKVKAEIEKCQVRCANCHRRKTAKEFGWNKKLPL